MAERFSAAAEANTRSSSNHEIESAAWRSSVVIYGSARSLSESLRDSVRPGDAPDRTGSGDALVCMVVL